MTPELPSGTVTFLFTDLAVSTRLWEHEPEAMRASMARHDELLRIAIESRDGFVVKGRGDGVHAVFATADAAVLAAVDCELAIETESWPVSEPLRVRIGIHTGVAELRDGDYFGSAVNRAARLEAIAHGGQIVCSQATADLARDALPDGVELVDLGEHRLRDLSRPEQVFQVNADGLGATFARLRSLDAFPGNLPRQVTSFVGRDTELARVGEALATSPAVTLTGVGGVGKTRLAIQVAAEVLPRFPDGAWLCELASVRDPAAVAEAVAGVFRVTARPGLSLEESLVAFLRDQTLLLVLDNCEHVLRPVAALVAAIEAACSDVKVLATSREGLNVGGEQILVVPSLGVPDDAMDLPSLEECGAVRLFVDRARSAKADFVLDASTIDGVTQVCRRLDGVPLAIELAAARVSAMHPTELARRLDRRFRLLSGGDRAAIERHQTLRAAIDWSYELLTPDEQRLLARLSVFAGGGTLEAVEAVGAGEPIDVDDVFELLAHLVAHHLVVVDEVGMDARYRLLETIRQYGEERQAETGETDAVRARHCDHYASFAELAAEGLDGRDEIECGRRLSREHDNLHAAMVFALGTADVDRAMRLLCSVPTSFAQIDHLVVFDPEPVLALPSAHDHPSSARALLELSQRALERSELELATELIERALDAQRRLDPASGYRRFGAHLDVARFMLELERGNLAGMASIAFDGAEAARRDGEPIGSVAAWLTVGAYELAQIDPAGALQPATEALALARVSGAPSWIAQGLLALGMATATTDPDRAGELLEEVDRLGLHTLGLLINTLGLAAILSNWPLALRAAGRVLDLDRRTGVLPSSMLGFVLLGAGRALAPERPEAAAAMLGAMNRIQKESEAHGAEAPAARARGHFAEHLVEAGIDTNRIVREALGDSRARELRAQGMAMSRDEACAHARREIDAYLATLDEVRDD